MHGYVLIDAHINAYLKLGSILTYMLIILIFHYLRKTSNNSTVHGEIDTY
jgi:hypothetical protein